MLGEETKAPLWSYSRGFGEETVQGWLTIETGVLIFKNRIGHVTLAVKDWLYIERVAE